jgi:hypothetical protein
VGTNSKRCRGLSVLAAAQPARGLARGGDEWLRARSAGDRSESRCAATHHIPRVRCHADSEERDELHFQTASHRWRVGAAALGCLSRAVASRTTRGGQTRQPQKHITPASRGQVRYGGSGSTRDYFASHRLGRRAAGIPDQQRPASIHQDRSLRAHARARLPPPRLASPTSVLAWMPRDLLRAASPVQRRRRRWIIVRARHRRRALTQSRVCCSAQGKSEKMAEAKTAAAPAVRARGVSHTPLALAPRAA